MQIYEYQVKRIYEQAGIPILQGDVAYTPKEAYAIAKKLNCPQFIVKAQIPSYLRGKGYFIEGTSKKSGLRKTHFAKGVEKETAAMLFKHLKTPLTGEKAFEVKKVYVEECKDSIARFFLSMSIDFETQKALIRVQDITKNNLGHKAICQELKLSHKTFPLSRAIEIARRLNLARGLQKKMAKIIQSLYQVFITYKVFEINIDPLILTADKKFYAMSGKMRFDPDAAIQDKRIAQLIDLEEETPSETKARINNCRYIKLDGNIGCIINGSGLGMATLDLFHLHGGHPSCLFDIGAEPTKEMTANAFKAVLSEPSIEGVFINIFGGTARCDIIAEGLISAAREISVGIPIVVRIDGTNEQIASRILFESGLPFVVKKNMDDAVRTIIQSVQEII